MPTKPVETLFDPDYVKVQIRPLLDLAIPLLEEARNFALNAFARCSYRPDGGDENLAVLLPYLHSTEMLDGIAVLLAEAAVAPAVLQMRSMFEALLTIEYVLEGDMVRRGHAYLVGDVVARLEAVERADPTSEAGKRLRQFASSELGDSDALSLNLPEGEIDRQRELLEQLLSRPHWKESYDEYRRLKNARRTGRVRWYQLFGGPNDLFSLAAKLGHGGIYETVYRWASGTAHVEDAVRRIVVPTGAGEAAARHFRDPSVFVTVAELALTLSTTATYKVIEHYRHSELPQLRDWYQRELRAGRMQLRQIRLTAAPTPPRT